MNAINAKSIYAPEPSGNDDSVRALLSGRFDMLGGLGDCRLRGSCGADVVREPSSVCRRAYALARDIIMEILFQSFAESWANAVGGSL